MRHWRQRRRVRDRLRSHRAFRIQQVIMAWPQTQADQCARIGDRLRLPAVIGLIVAHGVFAGLVPGSGRLAAQVMFANQRFLNLLRPLRINLLLAPRSRLSLTFVVRARALRVTFVAHCGSLRFCLRVSRTTSCLCSSRTGRITCLRKCRARRCTGTDQRQGAACTHPTPQSRATFPHAFQCQTSQLTTRPKNNKDPTGTGILIIPHCRRQCQFRSGQFEVTEVSPP